MAALGLVVETSFLRFDVQRLPLIHVQTHRQLRHAMDEVTRVLDVLPDARVRIYHPTRRPINWFLRGRGLRLEETEPWPESVDGEVLLASPRQQAELEDRIRRPYHRRILRFRDGLRLALWLDDAAFEALQHPGDPEHTWRRITPIRAIEPPPRPTELQPGWNVRWIAGRDFDAEPFLVETQRAVDVWYPDDYEKPRFAPLSVDWEAWLDVERAGRHNFATLSDDGSRLWIDGRVVVSNWGVHGVREATGAVDLETGWHHVRIQWFDLGGPARLEATWMPPGSLEAVAWPADRTWSGAFPTANSLPSATELR